MIDKIINDISNIYNIQSIMILIKLLIQFQSLL